jgi:hypothetical protein
MAAGRKLHPDYVQKQPHKLQSENIMEAKLMVQKISWNAVGCRVRTASGMNFGPLTIKYPFSNQSRP